MNGPLVSVVIPTKDRPHFLQRAVTSVVAQSYENLEIVVIDDGSSVPTLLDDFRDDPRVLLTRLEKSGGPSVARNVGIQRASGEYVAFLDDDDEFGKGWIEGAVTHLMGTPPEIAAIESGHSGWVGDELIYEYVPARARGLRMSLLREPSIALPTLVVKRAALDKVGLFDPSLERYEDWDLWLRLTDRYDVVPLPEIHVRRRLHHPVPAIVRLRHYRVMFTRLLPRLRTLPTRQRFVLLSWHARFFALRLAEVLVEAVAGHRFLEKLKARRLRRSGF